MENTIRAALICCIMVGASGCTTMTIEGDGQKTPQSKTGTHTVHASYYGLVWSSPPVEKCDNVIFAVVSIVSLGLYVPQTVEWWCDGTPKQDDNEELYRPAG